MYSQIPRNTVYNRMWQKRHQIWSLLFIFEEKGASTTPVFLYSQEGSGEGRAPAAWLRKPNSVWRRCCNELKPPLWPWWMHVSVTSACSHEGNTSTAAVFQAGLLLGLSLGSYSPEWDTAQIGWNFFLSFLLIIGSFHGLTRIVVDLIEVCTRRAETRTTGVLKNTQQSNGNRN